MAYDIEQFLGDLKACLVANLNTKLSAIDTEKNDGITLKQVDSDAYFLQDLSDGTPSQNPFVVYGEFEEPVSEAIGPATAIKYTVGPVLVLADPGNDPQIKNRVLRYRRALTEVLQGNWDRIGSMAMKMKVKATVPTPWFNENGQLMGRAVGVLIEVILA